MKISLEPKIRNLINPVLNNNLLAVRELTQSQGELSKRVKKLEDGMRKMKQCISGDKSKVGSHPLVRETKGLNSDVFAFPHRWNS